VISSGVNSIPEIFSKHIDYWLKKVVGNLLPNKRFRASHVRTPTDLPNGLPEGARLFSVDAVGMYSNTDTNHGVEVLTYWLTMYCNELPDSMPVEFILASLKEIMKTNIFQFGDTHWRQCYSCAMGTILQ
jgi:hypothetical protein